MLTSNGRTTHFCNRESSLVDSFPRETKFFKCDRFFSLGNLPGENFIAWSLDMSREQ